MSRYYLNVSNVNLANLFISDTGDTNSLALTGDSGFITNIAVFPNMTSLSN